MGYYTYHSMTVRHKDHSEFTKEQLEKINDALDAKDVLGYALEHGTIMKNPYCSIPCLDFAPVDEVKWYECTEDMIEISKLFPDCVFCVHGEGEERGDIWDLYVHDGDIEECVMDSRIPEPTHIRW